MVRRRTLIHDRQLKVGPSPEPAMRPSVASPQSHEPSGRRRQPWARLTRRLAGQSRPSRRACLHRRAGSPPNRCPGVQRPAAHAAPTRNPPPAGCARGPTDDPRKVAGGIRHSPRAATCGPPGEGPSIRAAPWNWHRRPTPDRPSAGWPRPRNPPPYPACDGNG